MLWALYLASVTGCCVGCARENQLDRLCLLPFFLPAANFVESEAHSRHDATLSGVDMWFPLIVTHYLPLFLTMPGRCRFLFLNQLILQRFLS